MQIISACCRRKGRDGRNRTSLSIQQAEYGRKQFFMAVLCTGHHSVSGEECGGYAAAQLTAWFFHSFITGVRHTEGRLRRSLSAQLQDIHSAVLDYESRLPGKGRRGNRGVSIEGVFLCGRRMWYVHAGDAGSRSIRYGHVRCLGRPHVVGRGILLHRAGTDSWTGAEIRISYLKGNTGILLGAHNFTGRWNRQELLRLWRPGRNLTEDSARLRLQEMCDKAERDGETQEQAAVFIGTDTAKEPWGRKGRGGKGERTI